MTADIRGSTPENVSSVRQARISLTEIEASALTGALRSAISDADEIKDRSTAAVLARVLRKVREERERLEWYEGKQPRTRRKP